MSSPASPARWNPLLQGLHWLSLLLLLCLAGMGLVMVDLPRGDALRSFLYSTHKALGVTLLALVCVRLAVRLCSRTPAALPAAAWQLRVAQATHVAMYVLLLAIPLSGWGLNSVAGQPLVWFGLFELPALAAKNPDWRKPLDTAHVWLFWTLTALVCVHVLAALHHHWIKRDGTLRRMLPTRSRAARA